MQYNSKMSDNKKRKLEKLKCRVVKGLISKVAYQYLKADHNKLKVHVVNPGAVIKKNKMKRQVELFLKIHNKAKKEKIDTNNRWSKNTTKRRVDLNSTISIIANFPNMSTKK